MRCKLHRMLALSLAMCLLIMAAAPMALASDLGAVRATKLKLNRTSITLYVTTVVDDPLNTKDSYRLIPSISPVAAAANAPGSGLVQYASSRDNVVSVDPTTGELLAKKTGTAIVTCRLTDGSNKRATCRVVVKAKGADSVTLDCGPSLVIEKGASLRVFPDVQPSTIANKKVSYSSSKKSVATVNSSGEIKGVKKGTAKITVKTKSGGKKYTVKVTVAAKNYDSGTQYRFYGVANEKYPGSYRLRACKNDLTYMNKIYATASFSGVKVERHLKRDQKASGIRSFLASIAANDAIDQNDVTIFYYSGHGYSDGSLVGLNVSARDSLVRVSEVKTYLDSVPGTVIVILDSCYSGQFIQNKTLSQTLQLQQLESIRFNQSVLAAFQKGKPATGVQSKSLTEPYSAAGNYKILTACAPNQESYAPLNTSVMPCSFFTMCFYDGLCGDATMTNMNADVNRDDVITLTEIYNYSGNLVNRLVGTNAKPQTVMMWPTGDLTPVYALTDK